MAGEVSLRPRYLIPIAGYLNPNGHGSKTIERAYLARCVTYAQIIGAVAVQR